MKNVKESTRKELKITPNQYRMDRLAVTRKVEKMRDLLAKVKYPPSSTIDTSFYFVVYVGSAFASVARAKILAQRLKTQFLGNVNDCRLRLPMVVLEAQVADHIDKAGGRLGKLKRPRGTTVSYTEVIDDVIFLAVGVRSVRKRFIMIATMGSMIAIPVPMKKDGRVNADRPRLGAFDVPELVQVHLSGAGRADQHGQLRE